MVDLSRLFQPRSIAVIGGGAWCTSVVEQCRKMGFAGSIWPLHPNRDTIGGIAAFRRLEDLPGIPDATFIGVNRHATIETVRALREMGAGGAVCFAAGFRETQAETGDGAGLQEALLEAAGSMPIIGPNCYGFINYLDGALLWPDQHGGHRVEHGVAVLTQSSNMAINVTMQQRGLPLAYVATAGNQAQIGLAEIGAALLEDPRVSALGVHVEGIGDPRAFEAMAARGRALSKPIVALKAGRSEQARAAAISHTASLAGTDAGGGALLRRLGIAQVGSLTALLEALKFLHFAGPLPSNRIVSMSCSGGEASLMADSALGRDIAFPPLGDRQRTRLREVLGPMVALANPLDYHTFIWNDAVRMAETFAAALEGDVAMGCLIADFPRPDRCDPSAWECVIVAGARAAAEARKPLAVVATLPEALPEAVAERAIACGIIPMHGLDDTLSAIEAAAFLGQPREAPTPLLLPGDPREAVAMAEAPAKAALAGHGLSVPRMIRAGDPGALEAAAREIGLPLAIKAEGIAHKTEAGGVLLVREDLDAALGEAKAMPCGSWLVEELIEGTVAELLIGIVRDPAHGFVLTLGAGGVLAELMKDSASLLVPVTEAEIRAALDGLRIGAVLRGYRGGPAADIGAIVAAVLAVQAYVIAHAERIEEVEINPLIATREGAVAVDALIRAAP